MRFGDGDAAAFHRDRIQKPVWVAGEVRQSDDVAIGSDLSRVLAEAGRVHKPSREGLEGLAQKRLIFLDVDGVLTCGLLGYKFDPFCVAQLNRIVEMTGAKVCLSSTWRLFPDCFELLQSEGVKAEFVGKTRRLQPKAGKSSALRGDEIQAWLDENPGWRSFVILDDDSDMEHLMPRLITTDTKIGLTRKDADRAIRLLIESR